jgi:hypothetical protein
MLNIHGRSGRVALVRTKLVLAMVAARLELPHRAARATLDVRRSVADILDSTLYR